MSQNSVNVIVELVGEDFKVPEDTLVRYLAVDDDVSVDIEMNETNELRNPDSTLTDGAADKSLRRSRTLIKRNLMQ